MPGSETETLLHSSYPGKGGSGSSNKARVDGGSSSNKAKIDGGSGSNKAKVDGGSGSKHLERKRRSHSSSSGGTRSGKVDI